MHRERKKLMVCFLGFSVFMLLWISTIFKWHVVGFLLFYFVALGWVSNKFLPSDEMYVEMDKILASREVCETME